jgi:type I restriction enzyme S subunit
MSKSEWPTVELGALIEAGRGISYGIVQPGKPVPDGVPVIRVSDVRDSTIATDGPLRVSKAVEAAYSRTRLRGGELLMTIVGTVGETAIVPGRLLGWNVARAIAVLPIREEVGAYWVKLALKSPVANSLIQSRLNTTVQATLNLGDLAKLPILMPPPQHRSRITSVLRALDDKIDLNRRMNETLEAMARAIFKDWFVDFGPTRAKMEGRAPYLAPEIWAVFPERLDAEGKPNGWQIEKLGKHVVNHDSKRIPVSASERAKRQGLYPYHGAAGVMDHVDSYLFDGIHLLVGEDGSVVRGNGMAVTQYVWGKIWVNNHAHVLQGKGAVSTEQLLLHFEFETVEPYVTGAVQPKLSQGRMNEMPFVFPGEQVCRAFADLVEPLFARMRANSNESDALATTRDLLLPKLISGEIRVKDAEKTVAAVA